MDTICLNEVKTLIKNAGGIHVSIFMPTHHRGGEDPQDPIRLKNLIRSTENKLVDYGLRPAEARSILSPAELLLTDNLFWRQQGDGLAIFIDRNQIKYYHIPAAVKEYVDVGERFYIAPLIPLISACGLFYVLSVSRQEIRLLQCTSTGSVRINLGEIPRLSSDILSGEIGNYRILAKPAQQPEGSTAADSVQKTGDGSQFYADKRNLLKYFDQLSKGINRIVFGEKAPMVLSSIDVFQLLYREVNLYQQLLPYGITGNPAGMSDESLRNQAWTLVKPYFDKLLNEAVDDFNKAAGTGFTAAGIKEVLPAAHKGRIRFLFIAEGYQSWGIYNSENGEYQEHHRVESNDEDFIELAAIYTLNHSGTIYFIKPEETPGRIPLSAVLRY